MEKIDLCIRATGVVADVGNYLSEHWGRVREDDHSVKAHPTDHDVVTIHDLEAEKRLITGLSRIDSTIGFTGEEVGCHKEASRYWLADPIDGTDAYIRGLPFCTVQLALIEDNQPVVGIVYDFIRREMVFAVKGKGTICNSRIVKVSDRDLKTGRMIIEIDVRTNPKHQQLMLEMRKRTTLYQCCASGWEFIQIACGRLEGKVTYKPWAAPLDLAAGHLLVAEAGGVVTNIGRNDYDFCNTDAIAGNDIVHRQLTEGSNALFPLD